LEPRRLSDATKLRLARTAEPSAYCDTLTLSRIALLQAPGNARFSKIAPLPQAHVLAAVLMSNPYGTTRQLPALRHTAARIAAAAPGLKLSVGSRLMEDPAAELDCIGQLLR
jgi:hypothetical protein